MKNIISISLVVFLCLIICYGVYDFNSTIEVTNVTVSDKEVVVERDDDGDVQYYYYIYTDKGKLEVVNRNFGFINRDPKIYTMIKSGNKYRMVLRGWRGWTRKIDSATEIKTPVKAEVENFNKENLL